jgi:hypothetical protein
MTNLKKKLVTTFTKTTQKFRKGDNEKGFIGAGVGAVLIALGSTGYLGHTIGGLVTSLTSTNSTTTGVNGGTGGTPGAVSGIIGFVNDVITLIGVITLIVGIMEYRRLRKQIFK